MGRLASMHLPVLLQKGYDKNQAEAYLRLAVRLVIESRDRYWESYRKQGEQEEEGPLFKKRLRPLVAASIGCYGAFLADGSEYSGTYGLSKEQLMEWHRPRLRILAKVTTHAQLPLLHMSGSPRVRYRPQAGADLLAFETVPCLVELQVYLDLLKKEEEFQDVCGWISLALQDSTRLNR